MEMNEQKLKEIETRCNRATPGPWKPAVWCGFNDPGWCGIGPVHENSDESEQDGPGCEAEAKASIDGEFIAASREDIPALIAALREAWKERDQLRQLCDRMSAILCHDDTDKLSPMKVLTDFDQLFPKE